MHSPAGTTKASRRHQTNIVSCVPFADRSHSSTHPLRQDHRINALSLYIRGNTGKDAFPSLVGIRAGNFIAASYTAVQETAQY